MTYSDFEELARSLGLVKIGRSKVLGVHNSGSLRMTLPQDRGYTAERDVVAYGIPGQADDVIVIRMVPVNGDRPDDPEISSVKE